MRGAVKWLKVEVAGLAGELAEVVIDDRLARRIALGNGFAEALQLFFHSLELQLAALLADVEVLIYEPGVV